MAELPWEDPNWSQGDELTAQEWVNHVQEGHPEANSDFDVAINASGNYEITHTPSGNSFVLNQDGTLSAPALSAENEFTDPGGMTYTGTINPVQVTEEASTFSESDVTVTHTNTEVSSGSIQFSGSNTSGNAIIEWDSGVPDDIKSWDLATFQRTLDGETVTVDVGEIVTTDLTIDDFEDGDITTAASSWDGWTGDTGSFSAQQSTVISGTYSGELSSSGASTIVETTKDSPTTNNASISIQIGSDVGNSYDSTYVRFSNSTNSNVIGFLEFTDSDGGIRWYNGSYTTVRSSWSAGTTYDLTFAFDFGADSVEISINGTSEGSYAFQDSMSEYDDIWVNNTTSNSGSTRSVYVDDATEIDASSSFSQSYADIGQNFDISTIGTSSNVALRANISRSDTANNPALDYAARRFTR